jgi:hypothetical protein
MLKQTLIAAALTGAAPALAFDPPAADPSRETRVPRMGHFLDWRPDGVRGLYIQADTGRWYYARLQADCPRLARRSNIRFEAAPNGDFDRYSAVRAQGWRCQVASVTHSDAPPGYRP